MGAEVLTGSLVLCAGAAHLRSVAKLSWEGSVPATVSDRLAVLVAPGPVANSRFSLFALRHVATAAATAQIPPSVISTGKLAAAAVARGTDSKCTVPEDAEKVVAMLLIQAGYKAKTDLKAAVEKVMVGLDAKAATSVKEFVSARTKAITQFCEDHMKKSGNYVWDFS